DWLPSPEPEPSAILRLERGEHWLGTLGRLVDMYAPSSDISLSHGIRIHEPCITDPGQRLEYRRADDDGDDDDDDPQQPPCRQASLRRDLGPRSTEARYLLVNK